MKKITFNELKEKANFISGFVNYKIEVEQKENVFYISFNYGCEGQECKTCGTIGECNRYLNYLIRKLYIKEDWNEYREEKL